MTIRYSPTVLRRAVRLLVGSLVVLSQTADADKDGWLTLKEVLACVDQRFPQWDANGNGSLDAAECGQAFVQCLQPGALDAHVIQASAIMDRGSGMKPQAPQGGGEIILR